MRLSESSLCPKVNANPTNKHIVCIIIIMLVDQHPLQLSLCLANKRPEKIKSLRPWAGVAALPLYLYLFTLQWMETEKRAYGNCL